MAETLKRGTMAIMRRVTMKDSAKSRDAYILQRCTGKTILHVGACDAPYTHTKHTEGTLLFGKLDQVVVKQIGIDIDAASASFLNAQEWQHSEVQVIDMNTMQDMGVHPEVIVFGETLEHLMNLEVAISNLKRGMTNSTELIISVPNALDFVRILGALVGKEPQHQEHMVAFTYVTLRQLLVANGLELIEYKLTHNEGACGHLNWRGRVGALASKCASYFFPLFSSTLVVSVRLAQDA